MIIVYLHNNSVSRVVGAPDCKLNQQFNSSVTATMLCLAKQYPLDKIVWCCEKLAPNLNLEKIEALCQHKMMLLSFRLDAALFLQKYIGYVEQSPFIKVNKNVRYPTWLMSPQVGVVDAAILNIFAGKIKADSEFEYFLTSVAKLAMPKGLFCYSEPQLLINPENSVGQQRVNFYTLFRFVKQHFKKRWLLLLLFNILIYEKQLKLLPFLSSLFFNSRRKSIFNFDSVIVQSNTAIIDAPTIDVIIPTMGRKAYLYEVLKDLARQTLIPKSVIIVEQNPLEGSSSDLDFLTDEKWPFLIKHTFTHQTGACNARNIALNQVTSDWVFLADDDIAFETHFCEKAMSLAHQYSLRVLTASCLLVGQKQEYIHIHQSGIFGSGTSFIHSSVLKNLYFDTALEHGYGEDTDFGLQLRNLGHDIINFPSLNIIHLKAPMGGFRTPFIHPWESEEVQPKPSPTIMYVFLKYCTTEQLNGYKLVLFLKLVKKESLYKVVTFRNQFQLKWKASHYWSNHLKP
jgi:glycosyltransferase involved in cell wall biosynthesis